MSFQCSDLSFNQHQLFTIYKKLTATPRTFFSNPLYRLTIYNRITIYKFNVSLTEQICSNPKIDMVYVIDGSGSIGEDNFKKIKNFIQDLNKKFAIGNNHVRVGIQEYSYDFKFEYPVQLGEADKNGNVDDLNDVVANMPYLKGSTYTGAALERARKVVRECFSNFQNFSKVRKFLDMQTEQYICRQYFT